MTVTNHLSHCVVCSSELTGRQKKFCSKSCKNSFWNPVIYDKNKHLKYQKNRGHSRKSRLIEMSGGCCARCHYDDCIAALSFHHTIPSEKSFGLDMSSLCHRSWNSIITEYKKCELLCLNCHARLHYLEYNPS